MSFRILAAVLLVPLSTIAGGEDREVADRVLGGLRDARRAASAPRLDRGADLDALATARARRIAKLPHHERLAARASVGDDLEREGIAYQRFSVHVDLNRGYPDPAAGFLDSWRGYAASWATASTDAFTRTGIGAVRAEDGWYVLVAILVEPDLEKPKPIPSVEALETSTVDAVNRARRDRGLHELRADPVLVEVAREHSRDMVRRKYFDHVAPDGTDVADRLRRHRIDHVLVGENIHRNTGYEDPIATAVRAWLESPAHRDLLVSPDVRETGVGVAIDDRGTIFFTQLFLTRRGDR